MKAKLFLSLALMLCLAVTASAQQDPNDAGAQDTILFVLSHTPDVVAGDSLVVMEVYFFIDAQQVSSASIGITWDHPGLMLDSVVISPAAQAAFTIAMFTLYKNSLDSTNANQLAQFSGAGIFGTVGPSATRMLMGTYYFHVANLTYQTDEITFDSLAFSGGAVMKFTDNALNQYTPAFGGAVSFKDAGDVITLNSDLLPTEFSVAQNYPNPFNPKTDIKFDLPVQAKVKLEIFNMLGQRVATLVDETLAPGFYQKEWLGTNDGGHKVASGVYLYRLSAGSNVVTKKMMMLK